MNIDFTTIELFAVVLQASTTVFLVLRLVSALLGGRSSRRSMK